MRMNKKGSVCILSGILLIVSAFGLLIYNVWTADAAGRYSKEASEQLLEAIDKDALSASDGDIVYPDYVLNPDKDMPVKEMDGHSYIGMLEIPALGLELPIQEEWSYPDLRVSPCRYAGSAYLDNMVICAHSYKTHFRYLRELSEGDELKFTDIDGNKFFYKVKGIEIVKPKDVEGMTSGEWDLTLFTCTPGGMSRTALRCGKSTDLAGMNR